MSATIYCEKLQWQKSDIYNLVKKILKKNFTHLHFFRISSAIKEWLFFWKCFFITDLTPLWHTSTLGFIRAEETFPICEGETHLSPVCAHCTPPSRNCVRGGLGGFNPPPLREFGGSEKRREIEIDNGRVFLLRQFWIVNYFVKSSSSNRSNESINTNISSVVEF